MCVCVCPSVRAVRTHVCVCASTYAAEVMQIKRICTIVICNISCRIRYSHKSTTLQYIYEKCALSSDRQVVVVEPCGILSRITYVNAVVRKKGHAHTRQLQLQSASDHARSILGTFSILRARATHSAHNRIVISSADS